MCTNYAAARRDYFLKHYGVLPPDDPWRLDVYRDYAAPIIRRSADGSRESLLAGFGMVPRQRIPPSVRDYDTMNARTETVATKRSFSRPWKDCQFCLIPAENVYEPRYPPLPAYGVPNYEAALRAAVRAKSERWGIHLASGEPFAVAGLWRAWDDVEGPTSHTFTMLTVNADDHPLLRLFHKHLQPDNTPNEKRGVVILRPDQYEDWLSIIDPEVARTFLGLLPADELATEPVPRPPRTASGPA
ncbi:SOS response-associated peptidase [Paraburkholderia caballeronis]|uniref:SOS response-associated peptidase n=1 Tax=Paraburkholderia caballeronis TaxID=416943 RepID=UPI001065F46F|nr:SOS response-associated peptidase family protein [Paraburkholderia caballeronis]TDV04706.1 putative SOS response-associated peptidase YedK [Paraburkholderia caballeronis]TDV07949.1 putative SOS response-associated peptidase YedK [Paraburkholderia caballeronis]TDV18240.1 putative SOS response-associated peptidase YedK [Paraburkholderia caballeronis]